MLDRRNFLQQLGLGGLAWLALNQLPACSSVQRLNGRAELVSPESQGVSSQGLIDFLMATEASGQEFHSIMVSRNGRTIMEAWWDPFQRQYIHTLYSLSKSFTSSAIGMLQDDGKLTVQDKVVSFFPDKLPPTVSEHLAAMRIHDLLTMHNGHTEPTMGRVRSAADGDWVKAWLALDVPTRPGTQFMYDTGATYMLSAIVQQVSGQSLTDFLRPRLFEPLGIEGADWEEDPRGIKVGGYGLRVRTQDILHFGELYLQQGKWGGKRLLSEEWIAEATRKQVDSQVNDSDWGQGYGYQFWRCKPGCYRGDGAHGQYCIVVPEKNAVIAITSESRDMGIPMQMVWDHILPAMQDRRTLPEDEEAHATLLSLCGALSLPFTGTPFPSSLPEKVGGKTYAFATNDYGVSSVSFAFEEDECRVTFVEKGEANTIVSGLHRWVTAENHKKGNTLFALPGRTPMDTRISSYYYWENENTLKMTLKYVENLHHDLFTFTFTESGLELSFDHSVSYVYENGDERPTLAAMR